MGNLAVIGIYMFDPAVHDVIAHAHAFLAAASSRSPTPSRA